ncbi:MAG: hypothetical protein HFE80_05365 [Clostridiaceae bacterium]|jgi:hypothetical protein|nr:hypothetical protein [Clostridiaceae bacterium]
MPTEKEIIMAHKSMAYDLLQIFRSDAPDKTYTPEELEKLIVAYIQGLEQ